MHQMNFLNYPSIGISDSELCNDVKKFVEMEDVCGLKFGDIFLIESSFWGLFKLNWTALSQRDQTFEQQYLNKTD